MEVSCYHLLVAAALFLFFQQGESLKCYQCQGCDSVGPSQEQDGCKSCSYTQVKMPQQSVRMWMCMQVAPPNVGGMLGNAFSSMGGSDGSGTTQEPVTVPPAEKAMCNTVHTEDGIQVSCVCQTDLCNKNGGAVAKGLGMTCDPDTIKS